MRLNRYWLILGLLAGWALSGVAYAQGDPRIDDWLKMTEHQGTITPGTKITMQNWQQYKQFMPPGMIDLFEGKYFWKMPQDVEMDVGPTVLLPLPKGYVEATEKYGRQTQVVQLPNGHYDVRNYMGGEPFPNPEEPLKGYKISVNNWWAYTPHLYVNTPEDLARSCVQDRFGNIACLTLDFVYRQTGYNSDPGIPWWNPEVPSYWFTEWLMVEEPEQSKYTAELQLYPKDNQQWPELYAFVPALRRSLRLSVSARCAPVVGSDFVQDDYKTTGSNGGIAVFGAKYLGTRKILSMLDDFKVPTGKFPSDYDMPLGFPTPHWGKFQLRDVDVIDLRRIPSESAGYCYGKKVEFIDRHNHYGLWGEYYDSNMKIWKIVMGNPHAVKVPRIGLITTNSSFGIGWDIQNDHATYFTSADENGHDAVFNDDAPAEYHKIVKYCTPGGLMQIMK